MANTHRDHALTLLEHYFGLAGVAITGDVRGELGECVDAIIAAAGREACEAIDERLGRAQANASRRVTQITLAAAPAVESQHEAFESVVALCDDGTMWYRDLTAPPARLVWTEIPNVPQPAQEATV